ncbi:hypothetical protein BJ508DRAFT_310609 [Ascobolus immersus RN42]|uniref:Uncharacterized protein n=1 Tax=Ascobolus immersus RN42 TaxID=1160509 RepID=A0A3N4HT17_ASCIM|nr:hypothetical protein BJ508DRAFT_310609 [Ascobolus immersus RN42]
MKGDIVVSWQKVATKQTRPSQRNSILPVLRRFLSDLIDPASILHFFSFHQPHQRVKNLLRSSLPIKTSPPESQEPPPFLHNHAAIKPSRASTVFKVQYSYGFLFFGLPQHPTSLQPSATTSSTTSILTKMVGPKKNPKTYVVFQLQLIKETDLGQTIKEVLGNQVGYEHAQTPNTLCKNYVRDSPELWRRDTEYSKRIAFDRVLGCISMTHEVGNNEPEEEVGEREFVIKRTIKVGKKYLDPAGPDAKAVDKTIVPEDGDDSIGPLSANEIRDLKDRITGKNANARLVRCRARMRMLKRMEEFKKNYMDVFTTELACRAHSYKPKLHWNPTMSYLRAQIKAYADGNDSLDESDDENMSRSSGFDSDIEFYDE